MNPANPATTASSTAAYHACTRHRSDLPIDDVPQPAARGDKVPAQLLANVGDVDLDQVGQRVVGLVEQVVVKLRPGHQLPAVHRQQLHQGVLAGRKRDRLTV